MRDISYSRYGAKVHVLQDGNTQTYEIEGSSGQMLTMQFTRKQKNNVETYRRSRGMRSGGGYYYTARGDIVANYGVTVSVGGLKQSFPAKFSVLTFDDGQRGPESPDVPFDGDMPVYKVNFGKGIPPHEHKLLSAELAKQNTDIAKVFDMYILDSEQLRKCNNLSQSAFNQSLSDFLRSEDGR